MTKKLIILVQVVTCLVAVSCSPRHFPAAERTDSVRVEVRERVVHDTATIEIPLIIERNITRDTTSFLENAYSESLAQVSGGLLHHTLQTRPQKLKTPVTTIVRDTIRIEHKAETIIKEVPAQLTKAQRSWISLGKWAVGILAGVLIAVVALIALKFTRKI